MAKPSLILKSSSSEHKKSNFNSQNKQSFVEFKLPRTSSRMARKINYHSYMIVSRKNVLQTNYQSRLSRLSQTEEGKAESIIMDRPGKKVIAGVANELLIPFDVT